MSEFVKIHVERYRIGEDNVSDNLSCTEHTFSLAQLGGLPRGALGRMVWTLIKMTGAKVDDRFEYTEDDT